MLCKLGMVLRAHPHYCQVLRISFNFFFKCENALSSLENNYLDDLVIITKATEGVV